MNLSCKKIIDNYYYFILFTILLLTSCYNCYGAIISKIEHAEIYENILKTVSHINAENHDNIIVLHGSLAWIYNIGSMKVKSGLSDLKANDLDFFVEGDFFYSVIEKLQKEIPKLNFKTLTIEESNITWCSCYLEREHNKFERIADFIKTDNKFSNNDVFPIKTQNFNLIVAKATWMIEYEKNWINNLEDKINYFTEIIKKNGNKWLALSKNNDNVYLIYKTFNKYNEHFQLCKLINTTKTIELESELTLELKNAKLELDKIIYSINTFLSSRWGIDNLIQKKGEENKLTYSQVVINAPQDDKTTLNKNITKPSYNHTGKSTCIKRISKTNKKESIKHMNSPSDSTLCETSDTNHEHDISVGKHCKYRVNNVRKRKQDTTENYFSLELTNRFRSISLDDDSIENTDLNSDYKTNNINPFTYSFSERLYSRDGVINDKITCTLNNLSYLHQKTIVRNIAALVIFALYFYYDIPIETAQEAVSMLISHTTELLMEAVRFSINSDYNWMITWPALYALFAIKYKRYKTKSIHALAMGLLFSYSCIYTCKSTSNLMPNKDFRPCPLPDWLGEIQEVPEFTMSNPTTHKPDGKYHEFFISHNTITSDKLTCDMITHIEDSFHLKAMSTNKKLIDIENCGLIHESTLSKLCYSINFDVEKDNLLFIYLISTESERCQNMPSCLSARSFLSFTVKNKYKSGYTFCCMRNNGACTIPNKLNVIDKDNYVNHMLDLSAFKEINLTLYRLITLPENGGASMWEPLIILKQNNFHKITQLPIEGIYMLYNKEKNTPVSIMCDTEDNSYIHLMSEFSELGDDIQFDIIVDRHRHN